MQLHSASFRFDILPLPNGAGNMRDKSAAFNPDWRRWKRDGRGALAAPPKLSFGRNENAAQQPQSPRRRRAAQSVRFHLAKEKGNQTYFHKTQESPTRPKTQFLSAAFALEHSCSITITRAQPHKCPEGGAVCSQVVFFCIFLGFLS